MYTEKTIFLYWAYNIILYTYIWGSIFKSEFISFWSQNKNISSAGVGIESESSRNRAGIVTKMTGIGVGIIEAGIAPGLAWNECGLGWWIMAD